MAMHDANVISDRFRLHAADRLKEREEQERIAKETEILKEHNSKIFAKLLILVIPVGIGVACGIISMVMLLTKENPIVTIGFMTFIMAFTGITLLYEYIKKWNNPPKEVI